MPTVRLSTGAPQACAAHAVRPAREPRRTRPSLRPCCVPEETVEKQDAAWYRARRERRRQQECRSHRERRRRHRSARTRPDRSSARRRPRRCRPHRSETGVSRRPLRWLRRSRRRLGRRASPVGLECAASPCVTVEPSWWTALHLPNEAWMFERMKAFVLMSVHSWSQNVRCGHRPRVLRQRSSAPRSTLRCLRPRSLKYLTLSSPNLRYQPRPTLAFMKDTQ